MILDGKSIAESIEKEIQSRIEQIQIKHGKKCVPGLAMILVGSHPSSLSYVSMKKKSCLRVGIRSSIVELPKTISESELLLKITELNADPTIDGILVQLPLPSHIDPHKVTDTISCDKDVDGFHPINLGRLLLGKTDGFLPCTPNGIKILLQRSNIEVTGKHVVIIGRSNIVGKPLAAILVQNAPFCNATVTIAHSHTRHLKEITQKADILVAAIGIPKFITADMVQENAVVVDVGINRIANPNTASGYSIVGDVDFSALEKKCFAITPVPKGVGPMTIAMLLQNTLLSFEKKFPFSQ